MEEKIPIIIDLINNIKSGYSEIPAGDLVSVLALYSPNGLLLQNYLSEMFEILEKIVTDDKDEYIWSILWSAKEHNFLEEKLDIILKYVDAELLKDYLDSG